MAWLDKRKHQDGVTRYRIRDRIGGKIVTVVDDAGIWKPLAHQRMTDYLRRRAAGESGMLPGRSLKIDEACDIILRLEGPTKKGGVSDHCRSNFQNFKCRIEIIRRAWKDRTLDSIGKYDVRDFLARLTSTGNRMRYLGIITRMFRVFAECNEEGTALGFQVKLPPYNPGTKWRKEMKPAEKRNLPDTRVLSPEEWQQFRLHLKPRTLAICELALRRFLRLSEIGNMNHLSVANGHIVGVQEKTGAPFRVPVLSSRPKRYDMKNFRRDFRDAQTAAGMNWPATHPLHFSIKDFRRTGATWAYRKTKDLAGISKMLGHTSLKTTELYLNISDADLSIIARAVDSLADSSGGAPVEQKSRSDQSTQ